MQKIVTERKNITGNSENVEKQKLDVQQDQFKLLCYQAETVGFIYLIDCQGFFIGLLP